MNRMLFVTVCIVLFAVSGCDLTTDIADLPLTEDERDLLGHWKHVHGIGNVWNWVFFEDSRSAHYFSTNMILGDTDIWYIWAASQTEIVFYDRDTHFAREDSRREYHFIDPNLIVIGTEEYELQ